MEQKTKETVSTNCLQCGGQGKPSKGFRNTHNIQTNDLSKEFETKLLDCIKCQSCGHSWIPEKSSREQALAWWKNLLGGSYARQDLSKKYFNSFVGMNFNLLTSNEIEEIWLKETNILQRQSQRKMNQKQFKTFDESLFKAYISKFSDEDKIKCIRVLMKDRNINNAHLSSEGLKWS